MKRQITRMLEYKKDLTIRTTYVIGGLVFCQISELAQRWLLMNIDGETPHEFSDAKKRTDSIVVFLYRRANEAKENINVHCIF